MRADLRPIFEMHVFAQKFVFVGGAHLAAEMCDESIFAKGLSPALEALRDFVGDGLFTAYNDETELAAGPRPAASGVHPRGHAAVPPDDAADGQRALRDVGRARRTGRRRAGDDEADDGDAQPGRLQPRLRLPHRGAAAPVRPRDDRRAVDRATDRLAERDAGRQDVRQPAAQQERAPPGVHRRRCSTASSPTVGPPTTSTIAISSA